MARALVNEDVPAMMRTLPPASGATAPVGEVISAQLARLRSQGWLVEELKGRPGDDVCDERRGVREYVIPVPAHRENEDMCAWDFSTDAMRWSWCGWSTWAWETFVEPHSGSKKKFTRTTRAHFFRAFTPAADRVYDVVIFRPGDDESPTIVPDSAFGLGVERLGASFTPPDPTLPRFVERVAALRSSLGPYIALQVYVSRFRANSTFLHAEFGKRRTRDGYVLALLSPREFVIVHTIPFSDTTREALVSDLRAILGAAPLE